MAPYRPPPLIISASISSRGTPVLVGNLTICIEKLLSFLRLFCIITSDLRPDQLAPGWWQNWKNGNGSSCVSALAKDNHMLQSCLGCFDSLTSPCSGVLGWAAVHLRLFFTLNPPNVFTFTHSVLILDSDRTQGHGGQLEPVATGYGTG